MGSLQVSVADQYMTRADLISDCKFCMFGSPRYLDSQKMLKKSIKRGVMQCGWLAVESIWLVGFHEPIGTLVHAV